MTFHKYPKIKMLGNPENDGIFDNPEDKLIIEEKIDGANFRFMVNDNQLIFGSRTQELAEDSEGNWKRCIEYLKKRFEDKKTKFYEGIIYHGECCVKHSMNYNWEKIPPFLGFDIFDLKTEKMFSYIKRTKIFTDAAIKVVPLIKSCKVKDMKEIKDEDIPNSVYASPSSKDQQAEGIVIKNYSKQLMAKHVRAKFKELNVETFGGSKKWSSDDNGKIVAMYCTNARIDKIIFKLLDDGHKLEMSLMSILPKSVIEDIYEEHWRDILLSKYKLDLHEIRKKTTKRCLHVLQQIIINNKLNNDAIKNS